PPRGLNPTETRSPGSNAIWSASWAIASSYWIPGCSSPGAASPGVTCTVVGGTAWTGRTSTNMPCPASATDMAITRRAAAGRLRWERATLRCGNPVKAVLIGRVNVGVAQRHTKPDDRPGYDRYGGVRWSSFAGGRGPLRRSVQRQLQVRGLEPAVGVVARHTQRERAARRGAQPDRDAVRHAGHADHPDTPRRDPGLHDADRWHAIEQLRGGCCDRDRLSAGRRRVAGLEAERVELDR